MEHLKSGVPFIVKLRTFVFHIIIALIVFVIDILLFQFLAGKATFACAEIKRANDAPHSEIVFSGERYGEDSFYYLKQTHLVGTKNTNVSCDVLMVEPDGVYADNDIYFDGTLESGTCAVSENLAKEYGLNVGETARVSGSDIYFRVARFLTAQSGIDKEYLREGIVILSYDGDLLESPYEFVSFTTDGDEYRSLISLVFIDNWGKDNTSSLLIYAAISLAAFGVTVSVCEYFLFSSRRSDYAVLVSLGKPSFKLFVSVWLENALKYILPSVITAAIYSYSLSCYGAMYAAPALYFTVIGILFITVYSFIIVRRLCKCRAKTKKR